MTTNDATADWLRQVGVYDFGYVDAVSDCGCLPGCWDSGQPGGDGLSGLRNWRSRAVVGGDQNNGYRLISCAHDCGKHTVVTIAGLIVI